MPKKDNLLALIASLSPNEKRHFKLYGSIIQGDKRYLKLFDALERKTTYNAAELRRELGLTAKQLADDKHYLTHVLLNNLRSNAPLETEADNLYNDFEEARYLNRRGLYAYAAEIAEATLKKARQAEYFELIDNLLVILHRCYTNLHMNEQVHAVAAEFRRAAAINAEYNEMRWLAGIASHIDEKGPVAIAEFEKLMQHDLMKMQPGDFKSWQARGNWFEITFRYCAMKEDRQHTYNVALKEWNYYKKYPEIKALNPNLYLTAFSRLINAEYIVKNFGNMLKLANEVKHLLKTGALQITKSHWANVNDYIDLMRMLAHYGLEKNDEVIAVANNMRHTRKPYYQISYLFHVAMALIGVQRPAEAIDKFDQLLELDSTMRPDWRKLVRVAMIMAHYDLNNYQILPHMVESTRTWAKRNKVIDAEFNLLLIYMSAIVKPATITANKKPWQNLADAIQAEHFIEICDTIYFSKWVNGHLAKAKARA